MTVKVITHPKSGKTFRLGRRRPIARGPRLALRNYLYKSLPSPPPSTDYSLKAAGALSQIYLNDQLGDCVIAGMEHVAGVLAGNAGASLIFDDTNTKRLYSAIGGYVDGDESTDNGCDEATALNYWQQHGLLPDGSHKIAAWVAVNAADADEVRTALWLFENLYFGVALPDKWVNPMPGSAGFTWDVAGDPDPDNGHCFIGAGYDLSGVKIDTWGMLGMLTFAAIAKYASDRNSGGELYAVLGPDAIDKATAKAPNGFDAGQLLADLDVFKAAA